MSSIPEEICFEILLKATLKSLLACKFVCKAWFSLISSHDFVNMHHNLTKKRKPSLLLRGYDRRRFKDAFYSRNLDLYHSQELLLSTDGFLDCADEIDYPFKSGSVRFMGSCDGLVCLLFPRLHYLCLWNPATGEYKKLPGSEIHNVCMVAFGYDYMSKDYKLLACGEGLLEVYSLGSNSRKTIGELPYTFPFRDGLMVNFNGDFHWLAAKRKDYSKVLVSPNISNEIFREIELPKEILDKGFNFHNLGVLEGCLCVLVDANEVHLEVWIMQDYGVRESWTKHCVITHDRVMTGGLSTTLIGSFKSGTILFEVSCELVVYDPKNKSVVELNIARSCLLYQASYYFESLVSLNSGTCVGRG